MGLPLSRAALLGGCCFASTLALDNGVGQTPPLGFNPWNCFGISSKGTCKLPLPWRSQDKQPCHGFNESVMLAVARAFVDTPLKAAGYEYVNLDCGYSTGFRGADGSLTVNATRYPRGMKWLGDQFHALGLKFGMYSDAGAAQCCSRVYGAGVDDGSLGHEEADAALFASWGVDYLKHDACGEKPGSCHGPDALEPVHRAHPQQDHHEHQARQRHSQTSTGALPAIVPHCAPCLPSFPTAIYTLSASCRLCC